MRSSVLILALLGAGWCVPASAQSALNPAASRVVGQPSVNFPSSSPNVTEGREFFSPGSVAVDRSSTPNAVFVADTGNNRVLGWRDIATMTNGQKADMVIGQVDFNSTLPLGPGTSRTGGFTLPTALAIDRDGHLYVSDVGNNRILRFAKPFAEGQAIPFPNMVIGQPSFNTNRPNTDAFPSERTLALASASAAAPAGLAFDSQGNLWATDALNHRVLRYPVAALQEGTNQPAADIVLGQPNFGQTTPAPTTPTGEVPANLNKAGLRQPGGIAVDTDGRVYVSDALLRVLVYAPPLASGRDAVRIAGVMVLPPGTPPRLEYLLALPRGLFTIGNRLGVADTGLNRIVIYDSFAEWPAESAEFPSPPARIVIGQGSMTGISPNRGQAEASDVSLSGPAGAHYSGTDLVVADTGNHRVLVFPQQTTSAAANKVLGQIGFNYNAPNLVEGRELFLTRANVPGSGIALDYRSNPPRLYISDSFNNRILAYRDARQVRPGDRADLVIGQNDLNRVLVNAPSNNVESRNETGLNQPTGIAVDRNGNLYVADTGNGRILRFPSPFNQVVEPGARLRADLVLGQPNFIQKITDPSSATMSAPYGVALTVDEHLVASDAVHHRVLFFRRGANGDFTNGQAAERVIGQPDFFTVTPGGTSNRLNSPRHLSLDTDDRMYLADAGNNRVLVYDRITVAGNDPSPAFTLTGSTTGVSLAAPQAVWVSPTTGEIWVANTGVSPGRAMRFPRYEQLAFNNRSDYEIPATGPMALTQDPYGNLYIAETRNRVAIHYNALTTQIAGNYSDRPLSPGVIGIIYPAGPGISFTDSTAAFTTLPLPTELNDVQVLLNDQPVPLYFVSPFQINFLAPMSAPSSGTAELQVLRKSSGQILAVSARPFQPSSPALFVQGGALQGQLAVLNEDNSINGPGNPARRGTIVQLFGTGQGFVPNAPPDGTAAEGQVPTPDRPRVIIGGPDFVSEENIVYSGLAPGLVGVWQINVRIPDIVAPSAAVETVAILNNIPSNRTVGNNRIVTTIAVAP